MVDPPPSKRVLVVDDEPAVRELLAMIVAEAGYIPHAAESGDHALLILEAISHETCLMISDVFMDGMNGLELAHQVRAKHPELRILLISGYAEQSRELSSLPEGVVFRPKPVSVVEIKALVEDSCDVA